MKKIDFLSYLVKKKSKLAISVKTQNGEKRSLKSKHTHLIDTLYKLSGALLLGFLI